MRLPVKLLALLLVSLCLLWSHYGRAQTAGWEFPTTSSVTVGAADNGKILASDNVPGSAITVTLPNPTAVGPSWSMGFSTGGGHGIIVNAPSSVYILSGQKTLTSFSAPSDDNYEFFTLQSDGTNFRLTGASGKPQLYNNIVGAEGTQQWTYVPVTGYSATPADNGTVLASPLAGGDVTVTLPSAPLLHNGWAIRLAALGGNRIIVQVNPVQGGVIYTPAGYGTDPRSSFSVTSRSMALLSFSGSNFYLSMYATNAVPVARDLTQLATTPTDAAPHGIWRLSYTSTVISGTSAPPLYYVPDVAPCSRNAGAGDGGQQVPSADGLCWVAKFPPGPVDVRQWGADPANSDNASFINAALAVAGDKCNAVGFPKGHFFVNSQIVVPTCSGLVGNGRDPNFDSNGTGTILDFVGLPALTDGIVVGTYASPSKVILQNLQVQNATKNCLTMSVVNSHIDDVTATQCAGEGIHLDLAARAKFSNTTSSQNGQAGITVNGVAGSNPPDISTLVFEGVRSVNNTTYGFYLINAGTVTFIATHASGNGYQGYNIINSKTITLIGTYARGNGRPGYKFDGSDGEMIGARAEGNNLTQSGSGDFIQAVNGSNLGSFYGSDDVATSGISIISNFGSVVHIFGTSVAGSRLADSTSIIDKFLTGFIGTSITFGGAFLNVGQCVSQDTTINNVRAALANTATASPLTYPGDGFYWEAYVPADNTVRIKLCAAVAGTPAVSAYNIRVLQ